MKTIKQNNFKALTAEQMNEAKGGYYIIVKLADGRVYKIWV